MKRVRPKGFNRLYGFVYAILRDHVTLGQLQKVMYEVNFKCADPNVTDKDAAGKLSLSILDSLLSDKK